MSRLPLLISTDDFESRMTPNGEKILLLPKLTRAALILFTTPSCKYCNAFDGAFKELANVSNNCQIGNTIIRANNIAFFKDFVNAVPYVVFYYNGLPYMTYDVNNGANVEFLMIFIRELINRILEKARAQAQQRLMNNQAQYNRQQQGGVQQNIQPQQQPKPEITTLGVPVSGFDDIKNAKYMILSPPSNGGGNDEAYVPSCRDGVCYLTSERFNNDMTNDAERQKNKQLQQNQQLHQIQQFQQNQYPILQNNQFQQKPQNQYVQQNQYQAQNYRC